MAGEETHCSERKKLQLLQEQPTSLFSKVISEIIKPPFLKLTFFRFNHSNWSNYTRRCVSNFSVLGKKTDGSIKKSALEHFPTDGTKTDFGDTTIASQLNGPLNHRPESFDEKVLFLNYIFFKTFFKGFMSPVPFLLLSMLHQ